jgi:hypothetical protein
MLASQTVGADVRPGMLWMSISPIPSRSWTRAEMGDQTMGGLMNKEVDRMQIKAAGVLMLRSRRRISS